VITDVAAEDHQVRASRSRRSVLTAARRREDVVEPLEAIDGPTCERFGLLLEGRPGEQFVRISAAPDPVPVVVQQRGLGQQLEPSVRERVGRVGIECRDRARFAGASVVRSFVSPITIFEG
jgi:hypothetical protein